MSVVAPHLVERLPFVFPLYRDGPHRPWVVRTGVLLYSALARAKLNGRVSTKRALRLVPQLRTEGLHSSALYADAWTNDGRLTIANVRGAADRGAVVLNYAEVTAVREGGADVLVDGQTVQVSARLVVNATGPWLDRIRRLEDPDAAPSVRLSKGVHLVVDGGEGWTRSRDDPARQGSRQLRDPVGGQAPARDDRHAARGGARGRVGDRRRRAHDPHRGERSGPGPRPGSRLVLGAARPAGRTGRDREGSPGDRLHHRADGDAERRGRQAHDLPADRTRRARTARRAQPRPCTAAAARSNRACADPMAGRRSTRRRARTCCTSTARSRPTCSPPRSTIPRCSSRSSRAAPICARRSSTRASTSGRARTRTSCDVARPRGSPDR